jgi:hypothetical protein
MSDLIAATITDDLPNHRQSQICPPERQADFDATACRYRQLRLLMATVTFDADFGGAAKFADRPLAHKTAVPGLGAPRSRGGLPVHT